MHTWNLRELVKNEYLPTDSWKAVEYDCLNDLGFELDGLHSMSFDYDEEYGGKRRKLYIEIKRKVSDDLDGEWIVTISRGKNKTSTKQFQSYDKLIDFIHLIFNKV